MHKPDVFCVGGTYLEQCREPHWDELFGSGLRAATKLASLECAVRFCTYVGASQAATLQASAEPWNIDANLTEVRDTLTFRYTHALATPHVLPPIHLVRPAAPIEVDGDVVLRFGMLEGDARVRAGIAVYDPQSAFSPGRFAENGSSADRLALVLNAREARLMSWQESLASAGMALLESERAEVVLIKQGAKGVGIFTKQSAETAPAFRTSTVFPIGSGDIFSAAFIYAWALERKSPRDSALDASRAVAAYCSAPRSWAEPGDFPPIQIRSDEKRSVYLAGPFFTAAQRWLVDEARDALIDQAMVVFSPFHDVGIGPPEDVVHKDLEALDRCDAMLAIADGTDPGTLFEVGYARSRGVPVVVFAESEPDEPMKMLVGSQCDLVRDFVSSVYRASWAALER